MRRISSKDHRLVDEARKGVDDGWIGRCDGAGRLDGAQIEASGEHRELLEQRLFVRLEERVRPVDEVVKGSVPPVGTSLCVVEESEPVV